MKTSATALATFALLWLCYGAAQPRHLGSGQEGDGLEGLLSRMRRFTSTPSFWILPGSGSRPLVDRLTNVTLLFYTPIKDVYNVPPDTDKRVSSLNHTRTCPPNQQCKQLKLCDKDLFQEPSCAPGLGCLIDLGGRLTNYRYYLRNLRNSGRGNKLNKTLLNNTINSLQDVLVYLQRDCSARVASAGLTTASCQWADPAVSCLPDGMGLAYDNNDVADETAVTFSRGLLEVTKRVSYA